VRITPTRPFNIERLDALVLGGGADIDPSRYGEKLMETIRVESKKEMHFGWRSLILTALWLFRRLFSVTFTTVREDEARDELEFRLLQEAVRRGIPVLGLCRGAQLINVFFGGTLYQDLQNFYIERPQLHTIFPRKTVHVEPESALFKAMEKKHLHVNSLHRQAVKDLGKNLRVVCRETTGVLQAIEHIHFPFLIGVQWHPEFLPFSRPQRRLFIHLVESARTGRAVSHAMPQMSGLRFEQKQGPR
jgi:putative glutamine amidotransferase